MLKNDLRTVVGSSFAAGKGKREGKGGKREEGERRGERSNGRKRREDMGRGETQESHVL